MANDTKLTRRDFALLSANIGLATFATSTLGFPQAASAQEAKAMLGHFSSANQQNFSKATGSMQKAMGNKAKVEYVSVTSGPQILTAMAATSMDLCNIGSSPMIVAFAKDLPVSMIYVHKVIKDSECLVVRNDAGITSLKDLKGKKIACPFNTSVHFALLAAMKSVGLTASDVKLLNLRPDGIPAAWQRKEIDGAYIWFPVLGKLTEDNGKVIFTTGELVPMGTLVFDSIMVRDEFKTKHPDLVLIYLQELNRINGIYRDHPDQMADVLAPYLQITRESALTYAKTTYTLSPQEMLTDTWMGKPGAKDTGVLKTIQAQAEFLKDAGQVTTMPADFSKFVDSSFVAKMI